MRGDIPARALQQVESINRIAGLRRLMPGLHLVVGHDHTEYQWKYLTPCLAKGWLSDDERRAIAEYEANLFDAEWRLRRDALPRFRPGAEGHAVGTVSEPTMA